MFHNTHIAHRASHIEHHFLVFPANKSKFDFFSSGNMEDLDHPWERKREYRSTQISRLKKESLLYKTREPAPPSEERNPPVEHRFRSKSLGQPRKSASNIHLDKKFPTSRGKVVSPTVQLRNFDQQTARSTSRGRITPSKARARSKSRDSRQAFAKEKNWSPRTTMPSVSQREMIQGTVRKVSKSTRFTAPTANYEAETAFFLSTTPTLFASMKKEMETYGSEQSRVESYGNDQDGYRQETDGTGSETFATQILHKPTEMERDLCDTFRFTCQ